MKIRKSLFVVPLVALLASGCSEPSAPPADTTTVQPIPADTGAGKPEPATMLGPEGVVD